MAYHFNTRIEILEIMESYGPEAGMSQEVTVAKPWADIRTIRGNDYVYSGLKAYEIPVRFIIRYRKGINEHMQIKWNGSYFNIESIQNDNARNETLTIYGKAYH